MQLFAHVCNAVIMNPDKHQLSCLLLVPLLLNMTAAHSFTHSQALQPMQGLG
jgi:hypothetical protein